MIKAFTLRTVLLCVVASLATASASNIEARQHFLLREHIRAAKSPIQGFRLGNSIMEGAGGEPGKFHADTLGQKLAALTKVGTGSAWAPTNRAVGGTGAPFIGAPISDVLQLKGGQWKVTPNPLLVQRAGSYALISGARNDSQSSTPVQLAMLKAVYGSVIDMLLERKIEPIITSDPPQYDMATGTLSLNSQLNDPKIRDLLRNLSREKGVSFIDFYQEFLDRTKAGADFHTFTKDGTHPLTHAQNIMGEMMYTAIMQAPLLRPSAVQRPTQRFQMAYLPMPYVTPLKPLDNLSTNTGLGKPLVARLSGAGVAVSLPALQVSGLWLDALDKTDEPAGIELVSQNASLTRSISSKGDYYREAVRGIFFSLNTPLDLSGQSITFKPKMMEAEDLVGLLILTKPSN